MNTADKQILHILSLVKEYGDMRAQLMAWRTAGVIRDQSSVDPEEKLLEIQSTLGSQSQGLGDDARTRTEAASLQTILQDKFPRYRTSGAGGLYAWAAYALQGALNEAEAIKARLESKATLGERLKLAEELIAAFESVQEGVREQSWVAYENGAGINVGRRIEAARKAYYGTPTGCVKPAQVATSIAERIAELSEQHGSLRAASRALQVDVGYLSRLVSGEKDNPAEDLLCRMGLRRVITYERVSMSTAEDQHD